MNAERCVSRRWEEDGAFSGGSCGERVKNISRREAGEIEDSPSICGRLRAFAVEDLVFRGVIATIRYQECAVVIRQDGNPVAEVIQATTIAYRDVPYAF